jgi:hypothetical protein
MRLSVHPRLASTSAGLVRRSQAVLIHTLEGFKAPRDGASIGLHAGDSHDLAPNRAYGGSVDLLVVAYRCVVSAQI